MHFPLHSVMPGTSSHARVASMGCFILVVTGPFASRLGSLMPPCKPMEPNFVDEPLPEMPAARSWDADVSEEGR